MTSSAGPGAGTVTGYLHVQVSARFVKTFREIENVTDRQTHKHTADIVAYAARPTFQLLIIILKFIIVHIQTVIRQVGR